MNPYTRTERFLAVVAELDAREERETNQRKGTSAAYRQSLWDDHLLSIGRSTGEVLNILIRDAGARSILEIGTSYGYSTLWLAEAASRTHGRLISLDVHAGKQAVARDYVERAGLAESVSFVHGNATETIPALGARFDFVLIDAWKDVYIPCFDLVHPLLNAGALVAADNMLFPAEAIPSAREYQQHVRSRADMDSVLLKLGHGVFLSRYEC